MEPAAAIAVVSGAIIVIGVVLAALFTARSKAAVEWRQEAEAIRARADRLHSDLDASMKQNQTLAEQVGRLQSLPDMSKVLDVIQTTTTQSHEMFSRHESRAAERHAAMLSAFEQLTTGLMHINDNLHSMTWDGEDRRQKQ